MGGYEAPLDRGETGLGTDEYPRCSPAILWGTARRIGSPLALPLIGVSPFRGTPTCRPERVGVRPPPRYWRAFLQALVSNLILLLAKWCRGGGPPPPYWRAGWQCRGGGPAPRIVGHIYREVCVGETGSLEGR